MLTYMVAEDAIEASAKGVDGPIQMAAVSAGTTAVLKDGELQPVKETAAAFQLHQLDFVKRATADKRPGTGLVPGGRGS